MRMYFVIGENTDIGEMILFAGSKADCVKWIWSNCDTGDLCNRRGGRWSGTAYYDTNNRVFEISVDKFYN